MAALTISIRAHLAQIASARAHARQLWVSRFMALAVMVTASGALVDAAAAVQAGGPIFISRKAEAAVIPPAPKVMVIDWIGRDVDGDGAPDFVNPTGQAPRTTDAYGHGHFGASRDGGSRDHEGVDFRGVAGQYVAAPISGYVTKIGYAGKAGLKYVEIVNRAIGYEARVFYVTPTVRVGDVLRLGDTVGKLRTLQDVYPGGMTDHVHLELTGPRGHRMDATRMMVARMRDAGAARG